MMKDHKNNFTDFVINCAVEFWRLEKRLSTLHPLLKNLDGEAFLDQMNRLRAVFANHQIEIHDPKGELYIDGRALKAIYFQEVDDLPPGECRVIETIKPSICSKGIQMIAGEVIVGQGKSIKGNKAD